MAPYYRTQVLLEQEQHAALKEIAEQEDRSVSHIIREMTATYLIERKNESRREQALASIAKLAEIRNRIATANPGLIIDPVELINEMRTERSEESERTLRDDV